MPDISASSRSATILAPRLTPPAPPVELVERAEIDTQLHAAHNVSLVLFCAPAGFGKTTVMARYFDKQRSNGVATVWILLDDADNDVERFLFKVQAALDRTGLFADEIPAGTSGATAPAALSLARHPDPSAFAWAFSGSNAAVADYLLETVMSGLSPSSRDFLLATGILDELNADLCNAVTGRGDCPRLLEELERANVFLTPIDDD